VHLDSWNEDVDKLTTDNPYKIAIGNKCDLENKEITENDRKVIIFQFIKKSFSERTGIEVLEVSAKNSYQIEYVFEKMTRILIERV